MDFLVVGVPAAIAVTVIVEVLKKLFKWEGNAPIVAALVISVVLSVANHLSGKIPLFAEWWGVLLGGAMLGLGAMGFFDVAEATANKVKSALR